MKKINDKVPAAPQKARQDSFARRQSAGLNSRLRGIVVNLAMLLCFSMVVIILIADVSSNISINHQQKNPTLAQEARELIRKASNSVGLILVRNTGDNGRPRPRGSAVVVRSDGVIVTNYHVIADEKRDRIYDEISFRLPEESSQTDTKNTLLLVKAIVINKSRDLALLRVVADSEKSKPTPLNLAAIELGDTAKIQLLDDLVIIGYPEKGGESLTISTGVIEGKDLIDDWIKTDARLIHGNSGGAAVDRDGRLIGIPTKIVVDSQQIDTDGDGFPDKMQTLGAVGFLRPAQLVKEMLAQIPEQAKAVDTAPTETLPNTPQQVGPATQIKITGLIRSIGNSKPIAGARVGLIPADCEDVTANNLLTWGGSNADGEFELNRAVPPGRYQLKIKAIGYEPITRQIEVLRESETIVIELLPSP